MEFSRVRCGCEADITRAKADAGRKQPIALAEIETREPHVLGGLHGFENRDLILVQNPYILLDHDGVRAFRQRRTGENANALAGAEGSPEAVSGGRNTGDF